MADFEWLEYKKDDESTWPEPGLNLVLTGGRYSFPKYVCGVFWLSPPNFSVFNDYFTQSMIKYYAYLPEVE